MIRDAFPEDAKDMAEIYNYYVVNTAVTFEELPVSTEIFIERMNKVKSLGLPWIVAIVDEKVVGYAYATQWKERSAYRFSVESTVYLSHMAQGKGLGTALYKNLIEKLKIQGIANVIGGVTLPNPVSVALHEKMGMKKVAHFSCVGFKFDEWQDVGYWQLNL